MIPRGSTTFFSEIAEYELERIVGPQNVITDEAEIEAQSLDVCGSRGSGSSRVGVSAAFGHRFPETTQQVTGIVQFCNEHRMPLIPRGGERGCGRELRSPAGSWRI